MGEEALDWGLSSSVAPSGAVERIVAPRRTEGGVEPRVSESALLLGGALRLRLDLLCDCEVGDFDMAIGDKPSNSCSRPSAAESEEL
jgi:hypothetical protein